MTAQMSNSVNFRSDQIRFQFEKCFANITLYFSLTAARYTLEIWLLSLHFLYNVVIHFIDIFYKQPSIQTKKIYTCTYL